jgi:hypothetical protein
MGGRGSPYVEPRAPVDLATQPGFTLLTQVHTAADEEARLLGAVHRSHQVILLGVAILAAIAGSSSAVWSSLKVIMVAVELALALGAFFVWLDAERGQRHRRWGEARKLAEDLRIERVAWAVGLSTAAPGNRRGPGPRARDARRRAGLPNGAFDDTRTAAWGGWAVQEAVTAQASYHQDQARISGRISHRIHLVENVSFYVLLVVLTGDLLFAAAAAFVGYSTPHPFTGLVAMAGAIIPAIGAAGLALEATLSLGEEARRSQALRAELAGLAESLGPDPTLGRVRAVVKQAIELERAQEEHWTEDSTRRRLVRAG